MPLIVCIEPQMRSHLRLLLIALLAIAYATQAIEPVTPPHEQSVRPGANQRFLSPDLDVARFTKIFEGESREIFKSRHHIVEKLALAPGMAVADIGAGTGLFLAPIAKEVGTEGRVYAVEISPRFIEHMRERVRQEGLPRVEIVMGKERSAELPSESVDLAFVCDTYHHFEYPKAMLGSLYRALRPGGKLVVIDFERIPSSSRKWVLDHVRAGKETFIAEIEKGGFLLDQEVEVEGLVENYMLHFRRP